MPTHRPSLAQALRAAGINQRTTLKAFLAELRSLSPADRAWFAARFAVERGVVVQVERSAPVPAEP